MTTTDAPTTAADPSTSEAPPAIEAENVSKQFMLGSRSTSIKDRLTGFSQRNRTEFWAVKNVSVTVPRGSMLGVIGRNGSGKSTFLRTLCGIYRPTTGKVTTRGRVTALLELGAGFHPELTGRENVYMNGAVAGLSREHMDSVMDEIVGMAEIGTFIDNPIETYSSGMRARLGFAVTVQLDPEILLADEITAVGDITFKEHGAKRMRRLRENGVTIVQVSHSLPMLQESCDQILWLHQGEMMALGDPADVIAEYTAHAAEHSEARRAAEAMDDPAFNPAWIATAEISPAGGAALFTPGSGMQLVLSLAPDESVPDPSVAVTFLRANDAPLGFGLRFDDFDGELAGRRTVSCTVPSVPLPNGRYRIVVELCSGDTTVAMRRIPFDVHKPRLDEGEAFERLDASWDVR